MLKLLIRVERYSDGRHHDQRFLPLVLAGLHRAIHFEFENRKLLPYDPPIKQFLIHKHPKVFVGYVAEAYFANSGQRGNRFRQKAKSMVVETRSDTLSLIKAKATDLYQGPSEESACTTILVFSLLPLIVEITKRRRRTRCGPVPGYAWF